MSYCTRTDVETFWNPDSVREAADDDKDDLLSPTEEGHITRAIERGAQEMNAFLELRYALADLVGNVWCRDSNAILAAYHLCARSGNDVPLTLYSRYREVLRRLADIRDGRLKITSAEPQSIGSAAGVSNFSVHGGSLRPLR